MALIRGFEHDIFISYAHTDNLNGPAGSPEKGWVVAFARMLQKTLTDTLKEETRKTGRDLTIYWDEQLAQGEPIDWQLNPAVKQSAIFLMIMSDQYVVSDYCNQEATWFLDKVEERLEVRANKLWPAFMVCVSDTDKTRWPQNEKLGNTLPFIFYDISRHNSDPRFAWPSIEVAQEPAFYKEFNNLQTALTRYVKKALTLDEHGNGKASSTDIVTPDFSPYSREDLFIVATDDMAIKTRRLMNACNEKKLAASSIVDNQGVMKIPVNIDGNGNQHTQLMIFLLGEFPGTDAVGKAGLLQQARQIAAQQDIKIVFWMKPGTSIQDIDDDFEDYKIFLTGIKANIQTFDFNEFPVIFDEIKRFLDEKEEQAEEETVDQSLVLSSARKVKLFIDAAKIDHSLATEMKQVIDSKNMNFRTFVPSMGSSQKAHNDEWKKVVGRCDGVILMYGVVDIDAIDDKLDQVDRLSAKRRSLNQPEISVAIVDAPPLSSIDLSAPKIRMISVEEELDTDKIVEFLTELSRMHMAELA